MTWGHSCGGAAGSASTSPMVSVAANNRAGPTLKEHLPSFSTFPLWPGHLSAVGAAQVAQRVGIVWLEPAVGSRDGSSRWGFGQEGICGLRSTIGIAGRGVYSCCALVEGHPWPACVLHVLRPPATPAGRPAHALERLLERRLGALKVSQRVQRGAHELEGAEVVGLERHRLPAGHAGAGAWGRHGRVSAYCRCAGSGVPHTSLGGSS